MSVGFASVKPYHRRLFLSDDNEKGTYLELDMDGDKATLIVHTAEHICAIYDEEGSAELLVVLNEKEACAIIAELKRMFVL